MEFIYNAKLYCFSKKNEYYLNWVLELNVFKKNNDSRIIWIYNSVKTVDINNKYPS